MVGPDSVGPGSPVGHVVAFAVRALSAFQKPASGFTTKDTLWLRPSQLRLRPGPSAFRFVL
jgi:hypothetical protein